MKRAERQRVKRAERQRKTDRHTDNREQKGGEESEFVTSRNFNFL